MTLSVRIVALLGGFACLALAAVWALREVVLEVRPDLEWPAPAWWGDVTGGTVWPTALAAALAGLAAVALLTLAVREMRGRRSGYAVEFGEEGASARLDVRALEQAMRRRVAEGVPGVTPESVRLGTDSGGWVVRLEARLAARDVLGAQAAARRLLADDLRRLGGLELAALDVVVTVLEPPVVKGEQPTPH